MNTDRHPLTHCALTLAALSALTPGAAIAAEPVAGTMELTPLIGYRTGGSFEDTTSDQSLDLDEGASYGLILNIDHDANTQWEFVYSHQDSELQLPQPFLGQRVFGLDVDYFSFGGSYVWRGPGAVPFIGAGIGLTHMSPDDSRLDSETRAMLSLNGGYKFFLTRNIGLRIEARGYATAVDSDTEFFCGNGACIVRVESDGFGQVEINAGVAARF